MLRTGLKPNSNGLAPQKILDKESFIKVFKYTGEFAKFKNTELKKTA